LAVLFAVVLSSIVLWILLVGGIRLDEMIVGAAVVLVSAAFLSHLWSVESLRLDFCWADVRTCWRIPWYVASDIGKVVVVFLKDVSGIEAAKSLYRVCGFKTSKSDARLVARRVLATAYSTMTPNSIVIGIDYRQSRMLFHQIVRSPVAQMMKELGAQPGVKRQ
jgi:multisubunit Na+/H+ antiporter MnhE subunit